MAHTLHRNFPKVADAEGARNALLASGMLPARIKLNKHQPLPSDMATGTVSYLLDALTPGGAAAAAKARHRSGAMLSVDVDDEDQAASADAIMGRFGASEA